MKIRSSTIIDIPTIFELYTSATEFQKVKFPGNIWPEFEMELIETEIKENRQWKLLIDDQIACIWATTFEDPQIWEERNSEPAVYIHRIATHPDFRGRQLVKEIVKWTQEYAIKNGKQYIRLDTCGKNERLIEHYRESGFDFLGMWSLKNTEGLPCHYEDAEVCFFEINLDQ